MSSVNDEVGRHDLTSGVDDREESIPTPDRGADRGTVSEDEMFNVLSNGRRREVIRYLQGRDEAATVGELAEHIATEENDTTLQQLSSDERKSVYVSLYQNHLPVMDDAGVVDYAENRKTVRLLDSASKLEPYFTDESRTSDSRASTAVALAAAGCVLLGALRVGPFAAVPAAGWALLGVVGLVGAAWFDAWGGSIDRVRERLSLPTDVE